MLTCDLFPLLRLKARALIVYAERRHSGRVKARSSGAGAFACGASQNLNADHVVVGSTRREVSGQRLCVHAVLLSPSSVHLSSRLEFLNCPLFYTRGFRPDLSSLTRPKAPFFHFV